VVPLAYSPEKSSIIISTPSGQLLSRLSLPAGCFNGREQPADTVQDFISSNPAGDPIGSYSITKRPRILTLQDKMTRFFKPGNSDHGGLTSVARCPKRAGSNQ